MKHIGLIVTILLLVILWVCKVPFEAVANFIWEIIKGFFNALKTFFSTIINGFKEIFLKPKSKKGGKKNAKA